jgi:precorrin-2/cobalt-factor-2 C20-methyltransferase
MTLKAVRTIEKCEVIGIPAASKDTCTAYQIALKEIPSVADKEILSVPIPMTKDAEKLNRIYREGSSRIQEILNEGRNIAFLNLGDPTIYGTYMQLHSRVVAAGYEAQLISGVTSFCTVAARLGISLGSRTEAIHVLPGCYSVNGDGGEGDDWDMVKFFLRSGDKVILMKSAGKLSTVKKLLMDLEQQGIGKSSAVTNCGMENEMVWEDIRLMPEDAGYFTTIVISPVCSG